eukprot:m.275307 g.275307  ORF g.275307 m.275307 type:complete len:655 (-) comp54848_c0_seq10:449-2413(-)
MLRKMVNCATCGKPVFHAERRVSCGREYHPQCLRCAGCRKILAPGQHAEHHGIPYCTRPCYAEIFGPVLFGRESSVRRKPAEDQVTPAMIDENARIVQKILEYNKNCQSQLDVLSHHEAMGQIIIEGTIKLYWDLEIPISLASTIATKRKSVRLEPVDNNAFMPTREMVSSIRITNQTTSSQLISILLTKYQIANSPEEFFIVAHFPNGETSVCDPQASILKLRLNYGPRHDSTRLTIMNKQEDAAYLTFLQELLGEKSTPPPVRSRTQNLKAVSLSPPNRSPQGSQTQLSLPATPTASAKPVAPAVSQPPAPVTTKVASVEYRRRPMASSLPAVTEEPAKSAAKTFQYSMDTIVLPPTVTTRPQGTNASVHAWWRKSQDEDPPGNVTLRREPASQAESTSSSLDTTALVPPDSSPVHEFHAGTITSDDQGLLDWWKTSRKAEPDLIALENPAKSATATATAGSLAPPSDSPLRSSSPSTPDGKRLSRNVGYRQSALIAAQRGIHSGPEDDDEETNTGTIKAVLSGAPSMSRMRSVEPTPAVTEEVAHYALFEEFLLEQFIKKFNEEEARIRKRIEVSSAYLYLAVVLLTLSLFSLSPSLSAFPLCFPSLSFPSLFAFSSCVLSFPSLLSLLAFSQFRSSFTDSASSCRDKSVS